MKNKGIGNAVAVAIIIVIVLGFLAGTYMLKGEVLGIGGESQEENNSLKVAIKPSKVSVDDNYTLKLFVINNKSDVMTIQSSTSKLYKDNQLMETENLSGSELNYQFDPTSIAPRSTKIIYSNSFNKEEEAGNYEWEISISTNYGTLQDSATLTVKE